MHPLSSERAANERPVCKESSRDGGHTQARFNGECDQHLMQKPRQSGEVNKAKRGVFFFNTPNCQNLLRVQERFLIVKRLGTATVILVSMMGDDSEEGLGSNNHEMESLTYNLV